MIKKIFTLVLLVACMAPWAVGQKTLPYEYGFENNDLTGEGWSTKNPHSNTMIHSNAKKTGDYGFRMNYKNLSNKQWLATPKLADATTLTVSFYYKEGVISTYGCTQFAVGYSTNNSNTAPTGVDDFIWTSWFESTTDWQLYNYTFEVENIRYIAIRTNESSTKGTYLYLDDFVFTAPVSCPTPTDVAIPNLAQTSATLSWTGDGTNNNFQYVLSTSSLDATALASATPIDVTDATSVTFNNTLTENQDYYFYVRTKCDGEDRSDYSEECHFKTLSNYPLPLNLTATTTALTASISWTAPTPTTGNTLTGYVAQYKAGEGEWVNATANISGTTCSLSGLTASTTYTFQVYAIYTDGESVTHNGDVAEIEFTTDTPTISLDKSTAKIMEGGTVVLTATVENNEGATINWSSSNINIATVSPATGTSTTVTGVAEDNDPVTITAQITVGGVDYSATCAVTVANEILMHNGSVTTCSGSFYDSGGAGGGSSNNTAGNYQNNEQYTLTINPGTSGNMVQVIFSSFAMESTTNYYDYLEIYDGINTSATKIGKYNTNPGTVTASNASGALTFYFYSDGSNNKAGWEGTISCVAPAAFDFSAATDIAHNSAVVNWTGGTSPFTVQYKTHDAATWETADASPVSGRTCTLSDLAADTYYDVKVTDATSASITAENHFKTDVAPLTLASATDITRNSFTVNWTGGQANYTVQYRVNGGVATWLTAASNVTGTSYNLTGLTPNTTYDIQVVDAQSTSKLQLKYATTTAYVDCSNAFTENFNNYTWTPAGWSTTGTGSPAWARNTSTSHASAHDGANAYCWYSSSSSTQYLILPNVQITNDAGFVQLSFYSYTYYPSDYSNGKSSVVLLDETGAESKELKNLDDPDDHIAEWQKLVVDLTEYTNSTISIAFKYSGTGAHAWYIDDVTITAYDKVFNKNTENGLWTESANWNPAGEPVASQSAFINGAATIPNSCAATANNITLGENGSITIAEGGQLICNNNPEVTMKKHINAWTTTPNVGNWYFIASPVATNVNPTTVTNMITASQTYDLYRFDGSKELGWENYVGHTEGFYLVNGQGYLYANETAKDLEFSGVIKAYDASYAIATPNTWCLVGNPYTFGAYVNRKYYKMDEYGTAVTAVESNGIIMPCTGVLVNTNDQAGPVIFTKEAVVTSANNGNLELTLTQAVANTNTRGESVQTLDNAIVSFNEGSELGKFYFGQQNANIYIPRDNKEYAIVSAEARGEMPVCFKAAQDGQYTITVNAEEVEMGYLHLIDNIAGADIDLLVNPSYSFNAKADDYESRFRLVFSANNENQNENENDFAFFSNGQLIVTGEGTLHIIDMMGRVISTEVVNGTSSKAINAKAGVYVLRLTNGENVKTQKIVVR